MIARLLPLAVFALLLAGCGEKEDPQALAAPPPKAGAVAPPVVPNGVNGGPQDVAPGSGTTPPGMPKMGG